MHFPTRDEVDFLYEYAQFEDVSVDSVNTRLSFRKLNKRMVEAKDNSFRLKNLDRIHLNGTSFEQHLAKLFDIFIRYMLEKAKGNLEDTPFWLE